MSFLTSSNTNMKMELEDAISVEATAKEVMKESTGKLVGLKEKLLKSGLIDSLNSDKDVEIWEKWNELKTLYIDDADEIDVVEGTNAELEKRAGRNAVGDGLDGACQEQDS
ncbi:hypothetical protein Ddye_021621 [Dipteronia dyeriana]|uniref:Uncharacterized protein n=1 Tax=Dipteronia dyeriana TaxID=168575 RepID=A0AAD9WX19_9ROSI|nr:hypothetical protein Ddye_021621 [Dipteronia dyeriana]